ncbi:MAG: Gldg family protein [Deltaproteobacteria bacterium]|nr:Gldg family protein [Deltaproteobacteria bacterium]
MAMRTASPFWLSLVFGVGLFFIFLGERLAPVPSIRVVLTLIGLAVVIITTAARAWTASGTKGARQRIERALFACHIGAIIALVIYAMTTSWAPESLEGPHAQGALTVLWVLVMIASIVPVLMIEIALGGSLRTGFDLGHGEEKELASVDFFRVRDVGWSGLSVAFALGLALVTCQVSKERNIQRDVSYFKTSMAGESTTNIVKASPDPLEVHLFFPESNEAKEYVKAYFETLSSSTNNVQIFVHDRLAEAELAAKYNVTKDGVAVLVRGTRKPVTIEIPAEELKDPEKLRKGKTLRTLDGKVNKELMKLARDKRKAYVMTGHGEMNDPESLPGELKGKVPERRVTKFKEKLGALNYEIKDLGLIDLAKDVPEDATLVIMLAPTVPLQPAEWAAIDRYLDKGGRLLLALDPKGDPSLGQLEGKLGLRMVPGDLTDDVAYLPQRGNPSDRRFAITTQFSAHASTTALSRSVDKGLILINAGALEDVPFADPKNPAKKTVTIRSMESSFLDLNNNFTHDKDTEKKQRWNIGVAVEGSKMTDGKDGYRALVFSDSDLFADAMVQNQMRQATVILISGPLLDDSVKWLGGEEVFGGDIVTEEDTTIEHTKNEKAAWFFLTVLGVPVIVLALGLTGTSVSRRRRRATKDTEVTP